LQTTKVYVCPTDRPTETVNGQLAPKIRSYSPNYHNHMDSSAQNKDLAWLRERTSLPK
jgi:hypothetical protein